MFLYDCFNEVVEVITVNISVLWLVINFSVMKSVYFVTASRRLCNDYVWSCACSINKEIVGEMDYICTVIGYDYMYLGVLSFLGDCTLSSISTLLEW